jgi:hypothetical protein
VTGTKHTEDANSGGYRHASQRLHGTLPRLSICELKHTKADKPNT